MLDDVTTVTLNAALSGLAARQRVTANNIANIDTPNFKAGQVSFEDSLRSAVAAGDPSSAAVSTVAEPGAVSANGNDVNLDTETVTDEKTQLQYSLLSGAMTAKFALIDTVLKG